MLKYGAVVTVAILAQGTEWAGAATQAFLRARFPRETDDQAGAELRSCRPGYLLGDASLISPLRLLCLCIQNCLSGQLPYSLAGQVTK